MLREKAPHEPVIGLDVDEALIEPALAFAPRRLAGNEPGAVARPVNTLRCEASTLPRNPASGIIASDPPSPARLKVFVAATSVTLLAAAASERVATGTCV